jgi:hypothetical protein
MSDTFFSFSYFLQTLLPTYMSLTKDEFFTAQRVHPIAADQVLEWGGRGAAHLGHQRHLTLR